MITAIPTDDQQMGAMQGALSPPPTIGSPQKVVVTHNSEQRTILFVVVALAVFAFTLYIVIVDKDLTALLVGLLIVFIIYALVRLSGPRRPVG